jgi:imidazolonepropionase-like amidohydrolase
MSGKLFLSLFLFLLPGVLFSQAKRPIKPAGSTPIISPAASHTQIVLKGVDLIDGTGGAVAHNVNIYIKDGIIADIDRNANPVTDAQIIDLTGKTVMPGLINTYGHLGLESGDSMSGSFFSRFSVQKDLLKCQDFGIASMLSSGLDHDLIYAIRDSSQKGLIHGATIYTCGRGFGAPAGSPLADIADEVYRPATPQEAIREVDELARKRPDMVKIWVDDLHGTAPKMKREVWKAIIAEAHKQKLKVCARVFYRKDARMLVDDGADVLARSICDTTVDDALIQKMRAKHVWYIPALCQQEYYCMFTGDMHSWMADNLYRLALEPGVFEHIMTMEEKHRGKTPSGPELQAMAELHTAIENLKKMYAAGVKIALGTDSGDMPVNAQGYSEHLELSLLVQAGLTPLQAITCATKNAAELLHVDHKTGTIQKGKLADLIVLDQTPEQDINNTKSILAVYKSGINVAGAGLSMRKQPAKRHR